MRNNISVAFGNHSSVSFIFAESGSLTNNAVPVLQGLMDGLGWHDLRSDINAILNFRAA